MKIKSIHFKHITHFTDTKINFEYESTPITLILGDQCSGKTSLLRSTFLALTWFSARYKDARTAGAVLPDQDIMQNRLQAKIDIKVHIPTDIGSLPESIDLSEIETQICDWQLYKTQTKASTGHSKVETQKLEKLVTLYQKAAQLDPLQGLPLIAYYPSERFVHEINLMNKNNPAIFQVGNAYEITTIPYTTFARFFEWFREISDIENAQTTDLVNRLIASQQSDDPHQDLSSSLIDAYNQMHAPNLTALKDALAIIFPDLSNIYLQYLPKLQLMVTYQGKIMMFQQLSNSLKNWIALIGDIVRRMCLLNPSSLYPCLEGDGILLIDEIDQQLDQDECSNILARLNRAFPQLQIIATGNRIELLEQAADYQCLQLQNQQLHPIMPPQFNVKFDEIYQNLNLDSETLLSEESENIEHLSEPLNTAQSMYELIHENLDAEQFKDLLLLLNNKESISSEHKLHE